MTMYDRGHSEGARIVAESDEFVSWVAHPHEEAERTSHAIRTEEGVWVLDPLDAPNVGDVIDSLGDVVGVAVLSCWHARDAGVLARRHDVSVHVPAWMARITERVAAPVERYTLAPGGAGSGFHAVACRPFPGWQEVFLYHDPTGTLVSPESFGTTDHHCLADEQLGLMLLRRLQPPVQLGGLDPDRILVGHGEPVTEDASRALERALDGARRSFPNALREHGLESVRGVLAALL